MPRCAELDLVVLKHLLKKPLMAAVGMAVGRCGSLGWDGGLGGRAPASYMTRHLSC